MKKLLILFLGLSFFMACDDEADLEEQGFTLEELPGYVAFNAPGTSVTLDNFTTDELSGSIAVNVEVPTGTLTDVTVNYSLSGSAVFGVDYTIAGATAAGGTLVIPAGADEFQDLSNEDIVISLLKDAVDDGDKTINIELLSASNAEGELAVGRGTFLTTAVVDIADVPWTVDGFTVAEASTLENSVDVTSYTVELNYDFTEDITFDVAVFGDLVLNDDYTFDSFMNTLTIPAGETKVSFGVINVDDNLAEGEDSLLFVISNPSTAEILDLTLGAADSSIFYQDDEPKVLELDVDVTTITLDTVNQSGFYEFSVVLSDISSEAVSIDYDISAIGGVAGVDYIDQTGGTVIFEPGQTRSSIVIRVLPQAFNSVDDINLDVSIDDASLATADAEVSIGTSLEFELNVVNE